MPFIKETKDMKIEETFSLKQEDTEEQTKMVFIKEGTEDLRIKETFSVMQKNTETQTKMVFTKERSENMKTEEKSRVKQDDTGAQTDCPLCLRGYHQLSQHLRLTHKVINSQERKLLLAISSGRVDVHKSTCPVPACGKSTSRIDRHLKDHTELTRAAQRETMQALKRKKIIDNLAELRASNPSVPMATTLDLEEAQDLMNAPPPPEEEEGGTCNNPRCQQAHKQLQDQVADLNRQVDMLSRALRYVTHRYQLLRRRSRSTPSTPNGSSLPREETGRGGRRAPCQAFRGTGQPGPPGPAPHPPAVHAAAGGTPYPGPRGGFKCPPGVVQGPTGGRQPHSKAQKQHCLEGFPYPPFHCVHGGREVRPGQSDLPQPNQPDVVLAQLADTG